MRRVPLLEPRLRKDTDLMGGLLPLASHGRMSSLSFDLDSPVQSHRLPGRGNLMNSAERPVGMHVVVDSEPEWAPTYVTACFVAYLFSLLTFYFRSVVRICGRQK